MIFKFMQKIRGIGAVDMGAPQYQWKLPGDLSWVSSSKDFDNMRVNKTIVRAWGLTLLGHLPKEQEIVGAEFQRSFLYFKIIDVDKPWNPGDQFFLDLKLIYIEPKPSQSGASRRDFRRRLTRNE